MEAGLGSWLHPEPGGLQTPADRQYEHGMHGKKINEANQQNPQLMSRLEIISQNLFWLGVAAPTCQTSGEARSSGGGCCCPAGALEMKRGFVNTRLYPGLVEGWLGPGWEGAPSSNPALPDSRCSSPPAWTCQTVPKTLPLLFSAWPEKHWGSDRESKIVQSDFSTFCLLFFSSLLLFLLASLLWLQGLLERMECRVGVTGCWRLLGFGKKRQLLISWR